MRLIQGLSRLSTLEPLVLLDGTLSFRTEAKLIINCLANSS